MIEASARRKAALWVAAVFLLGAALGGVLGYTLGHHAVSAAGFPKTEQERRARRMEQLTQELTLSSEQQQQLDAILSEVHAEYKSLHQQSDAKMDEARQRARNRIREILTPEQKPKFEVFLKRLDEERKRNSPPPPR
jgi:Spy/CpxP family protein refolding chaperone